MLEHGISSGNLFDRENGEWVPNKTEERMFMNDIKRRKKMRKNWNNDTFADQKAVADLESTLDNISAEEEKSVRTTTPTAFVANE